MYLFNVVDFSGNRCVLKHGHGETREYHRKFKQGFIVPLECCCNYFWLFAHTLLEPFGYYLDNHLHNQNVCLSLFFLFCSSLLSYFCSKNIIMLLVHRYATNKLYPLTARAQEWWIKLSDYWQRKSGSLLYERFDWELIQFQHDWQICSILYSLSCCVMDNGQHLKDHMGRLAALNQQCAMHWWWGIVRGLHSSNLHLMIKCWPFHPPWGFFTIHLLAIYILLRGSTGSIMHHQNLKPFKSDFYHCVVQPREAIIYVLTIF